MAKWSSNQSVKLKLTTVGFFLHLYFILLHQFTLVFCSFSLSVAYKIRSFSFFFSFLFDVSIVLWKLCSYSIYDTFQSLCASFYWFILIIFISQRFLFFCVLLTPSSHPLFFRFQYFTLPLSINCFLARFCCCCRYVFDWTSEWKKRKLIFKLCKCCLASDLYIATCIIYTG